MQTYGVAFSVQIPDHVSAKDVEEWIAYRIHARHDMSGDNPLINKELEPVLGSANIRRMY